MIRSRAGGLFLIGLLCLAPPLSAEQSTRLLEPWPEQRSRTYEVDKYPVAWRQKASKAEGVFAGVRFTAPTPPQQAWDLATGYDDIGQGTAGVTSVKVTPLAEGRERIDVSLKVLWKRVTLHFDVERHPPELVMFRLDNPRIGDYEGVCRFSPDGQGTRLEAATRFRPAMRGVPYRLMLLAERITILNGIKSFLALCETASEPGQS